MKKPLWGRKPKEPIDIHAGPERMVRAVFAAGRHARFIQTFGANSTIPHGYRFAAALAKYAYKPLSKGEDRECSAMIGVRGSKRHGGDVVPGRSVFLQGIGWKSA